MSGARPVDRGPQAGELFEQIALILQGGGALGSYQGGVYQLWPKRTCTPKEKIWRERTQ
jgi:predicted acylesterase/phospholipase RssA